MIRCEDIYVRAGDFALSLSFDVEEGHFFSLLGASGSGKTTFLRTIAGLHEAERGICMLGSENIFTLVPERRNIGMVFQDYALFPHMTVYQNIEYGLKMQKKSVAFRRTEVTRLLKECALLQKANQKPRHLSGGEQQRVALARALAPSPRILLLDEPLSALDAHLRDDLRKVIRNIQQRRRITTFYVTHDRQEAFALSDTIAVLRDGALQQIGSPEQLYRYPENEYVAAFVGEGNSITAQVVTQENDYSVLSTAFGAFKAFDAPPQGKDLVRMFFRPEDLVPASEEEKAAKENILSAPLLHSELRGSFRRIVLNPDIISYRPSYERHHPRHFFIPPSSIRIF